MSGIRSITFLTLNPCKIFPLLNDRIFSNIIDKTQKTGDFFRKFANIFTEYKHTITGGS